MTDKELLELAAKAAGIGPLDFDYAQREGHGLYFGPRLPLPQGVLMAANYTYWSPLTDDGDALRLAIRVGILIDVRYTDPSAQRYNRVMYWPTPQKGEPIDFGDIEPDIFAVTRRAIVRAAAAIGETL